METNMQDLIDIVMSIDRKLSGFESVLNFMGLGMEALDSSQHRHEINVVRLLYAEMVSVRKNELHELNEMLERMKE